MKSSSLQKWELFFNTVIDPAILIFSIITVSLVVISTNHYNQIITVILSLLISFCSGVIGSRLTKIWAETSDRNLLQVKGKSTIKDVILFIENIGFMKNRINTYINKFDDVTNFSTTKICYEELIEKCNILEREAINSIESWSDIIPDADLSVKIENIHHLKKNLVKETMEKEKLIKEIDAMRAKPEREKEELKIQLQEQVQKVSRLEYEIEKKVEMFNSSAVGGMSIHNLAKLTQ